MQSSAPIQIVREGPVATVTIRRPEVHNAFDSETVARLKAAFDGFAGEPGLRVVVLAGEGRSFSAGADLNVMRRAVEWSEEENVQDAAQLAAMLRSVAECPLPVVARVQGSAFGGGVGLVAAADVAIAVDSARFGFTEARLGIVPATIAPWVISKIGAGWARKLFVMGERFDAALALQIGLVHEVVVEAKLDDAVRTAVDGLLASGPEAIADCKRLVEAVAGGSEVAVDAYTARMIARARTRSEGREGVLAFLEKRKPQWSVEPDS